MNSMPSPSLVLTGFMGTGKTCVGRMIAQQLERPFFDMDALIEVREGKSVREIFEAPGEPYFRAREAEWCAWLARYASAVIATGGGTLVAPRNRVAFAQAFVVCLDAGPKQVLARLGDARERPVLAGACDLSRIEQLLKERRDAYAAFPRHVDTTSKSIGAVAAEIIALYRAELGTL